jgi:nucleotide-binding universal stress UspA family protein
MCAPEPRQPGGLASKVKTQVDRREKKMPGIIVGIDGSDRSRQALEWAVNEAAVRHAPLTVLTVNQPINSYWGGPLEYPEDQDLTEKAREEAQQETDSVLEKLDEAARPRPVIVRAVPGLPAVELLHASDGADMIVVGSRGAGGFNRPTMGSVSTMLTQHAHCPVVVIPADDL